MVPMSEETTPVPWWQSAKYGKRKILHRNLESDIVDGVIRNASSARRLAGTCQDEDPSKNIGKSWLQQLGMKGCKSEEWKQKKICAPEEHKKTERFPV